MQGLYMLDGNLIADGTKTAIATAKPVDMSGYKLLIIRDADDTQIVGVVRIGEPEGINTKEFDARFSQHKVSPENRMQWWAGRKHLYTHRVLRVIHFDNPIPTQVQPGTNMAVKQVDIGTASRLKILSMVTENDGTFTYEYEEAE